MEEKIKGKIIITKAALKKLISCLLMEVYGVVDMRPVSFYKYFVSFLCDEHTNSVELEITEEGRVKIRLNVVLEYGINILEVTKTIIHQIKYKITSLLNIPEEQIDIEVVVLGVRITSFE